MTPPISLLPLMLACSDFKDPGAEDTGEPAPVRVELRDADELEVEEDLFVELEVRLAGSDVLLDWADLVQADDGLPLEPTTGVADVWLRQFPDLTPEEVVDGLVDDTLAQPDVGVSVRCTPTGRASSVAMSACTFALGHAVDVPDEFQPDSGTWLAELRDGDAGPALTRVFLTAADDGPDGPVLVDDLTSSVDVVVTGDVVPVPLPAVTGTELDWSALTTSLTGSAVDPARFEELLLVRTLDDDPVGALVLAPERVALDTWRIDPYGRTSMAFGELWAESGTPPLPDGSDWWLVFRGGDHALHRTQVVVPLQLE